MSSADTDLDSTTTALNAMTFAESTAPTEQTESESKKKPPPITSLDDLRIWECHSPSANPPNYVTCYHITPEDEVYFGQSPKRRIDLTLEECTAMLEHVKDEEIYPQVPIDTELKITPEDLDDASIFIKRPGLFNYESFKGGEYIVKEVLHELRIMELISKTPHPNIIHYYGCRIKRGRVTGLVLENLDKTLFQHYVIDNAQPLDTEKFMEKLESAVEYLHSLGLAHNDINPYNIMVKNGMPVLIDFGSCGEYGLRLQSCGSPGWCEEDFSFSEAKHDTYSLVKVREWLVEQSGIGERL